MNDVKAKEILIATYSAMHALEDDNISTVGIDKKDLPKIREYIKDAALGGVADIYGANDKDLDGLMDKMTKVIVKAAKEIGAIPEEADVDTRRPKHKNIF